MQDTSPRVSVIVPVYNVERYLEQALDSIESQTLKDIEILCVNDGSTDGSLQIMERHAERDERIRIIDKPNGGYGSACNRGLAEARGAWIAIVEPDDWISATMFEDMISYADSFAEDIDIVKTPYWRVLDPDTSQQRILNCSYKRRIRPSRQPFKITDKGADHLLIHHPSIWSALYCKRFLDAHGIRFMEIPGAGWADNPFLVETLCQATAIVYLDKAYYFYREETEEKTASFAQSNTTVPFQRWHDMMDVLERLGIRDERVLKAQYRRGFTYLDYVAGEIEANNPHLQGVMADMFARMDSGLVLGEPHISPTWKKRYLEAKGITARTINPAPYFVTLAGAGFYSIRNVGPREALRLVGSVLRHNKTAGEVGESAARPNVSENRLAAEEVRSLNTSLSIIVPVYNAERYLDECLSSLAEQTYRPFEVICVNDGSTDRSRAILDDWAAHDERFHVIDQENAGPSSARNTGIEAATGDYICFLDSDDLFEPTACQRILEEAEEHACDCIVYGWSCFPPEAANDPWIASRTNVRDAYYPRFGAPLLFEENTNPFLRIAVRRGLLAQHDIRFDEQLRVGEDAAFLFSLLPRAEATKLISDKLYRYRMPREDSIMSTALDGTPEKCADDLLMMTSIFADWQRAHLLELYGDKLVHWFITFMLYTMLRFPAETRDPLACTAKEFLCAFFSPQQLRALNLPAHDMKLLGIVLGASDGHLNVSEGKLARVLLGWRIAEYGMTDLAKTVTNRIMLLREKH